MSEEHIGDRIKAAYKAKGLSKAELARRVGIRPESIWRYEVGDSTPRYDILVKIAQVTGESLDWLATGDRRTPAPMRSGIDWLALSERIRVAYESVPMTRAELTRATGLNYNTIWRYEHAAESRGNKPTTEALAAIASATGRSLDWLVHGDATPEWSATHAQEVAALAMRRLADLAKEKA